MALDFHNFSSSILSHSSSNKGGNSTFSLEDIDNLSIEEDFALKNELDQDDDNQSVLSRFTVDELLVESVLNEDTEKEYEPYIDKSIFVVPFDSHFSATDYLMNQLSRMDNDDVEVSPLSSEAPTASDEKYKWSREWVKQYLEECPGSYVSRAKVYTIYKEKFTFEREASKCVQVMLEEGQMTRVVKTIFPQVQVKRFGKKQGSHFHYFGLKWRKNAEKEHYDSESLSTMENRFKKLKRGQQYTALNQYLQLFGIMINSQTGTISCKTNTPTSRQLRHLSGYAYRSKAEKSRFSVPSVFGFTRLPEEIRDRMPFTERELLRFIEYYSDHINLCKNGWLNLDIGTLIDAWAGFFDPTTERYDGINWRHFSRMIDYPPMGIIISKIDIEMYSWVYEQFAAGIGVDKSWDDIRPTDFDSVKGFIYSIYDALPKTMSRIPNRLKTSKTLSLLSFLRNLLNLYRMRHVCKEAVVTVKKNKTCLRNAIGSLFGNIKNTIDAGERIIPPHLIPGIAMDVEREVKKIVHGLKHLVNLESLTFNDLRETVDIFIIDHIHVILPLNKEEKQNVFSLICKEYSTAFTIISNHLLELLKFKDQEVRALGTVLSAFESILKWIIDQRMLFLLEQKSIVKFEYSALILLQDLVMEHFGLGTEHEKDVWTRQDVLEDIKTITKFKTTEEDYAYKSKNDHDAADDDDEMESPNESDDDEPMEYADA